MDPQSWSVDPDAVVVVPTLVAGYALLQVWWPASSRRRLAFAVSQLLLLAVFLTPLETLALHYLLSAHLLQNVVVAEWAPGLAVVGIAPTLAREVERYRLARALTLPHVALPLWLGTYFVWHVPWIYDTATDISPTARRPRTCSRRSCSRPRSGSYSHCSRIRFTRSTSMRRISGALDTSPISRSPA
ncbi:MAG: cytochrome c oxidase assembly protein [Actinobacteria bacterium]|nr:MAG: cytochrome c oxidase assembly protein [Actinomycetota bacterium]